MCGLDASRVTGTETCIIRSAQWSLLQIASGIYAGDRLAARLNCFGRVVHHSVNELRGVLGQRGRSKTTLVRDTCCSSCRSTKSLTSSHLLSLVKGKGRKKQKSGGKQRVVMATAFTSRYPLTAASLLFLGQTRAAGVDHRHRNHDLVMATRTDTGYPEPGRLVFRITGLAILHSQSARLAHA